MWAGDTAWVQISALPLLPVWPRATCLDLSVPQLPHLRHGDSGGLPHRAAVRTK